MKRIFVVSIAVLLAGCTELRNSPTQQAEDYKTCTDAGMVAYLSLYQQIKCAPPNSKQQTEEG